jgi:hypothetical protein
MQGTWVLRGTQGDEGDERIGGAMRAHYREDPALVDGVGCDFIQLHSKPRGPDSHSDPLLVSASPPDPLSQSVPRRQDAVQRQRATADRLLRLRAAAHERCAVAVAPQ